MRDAQCIKCGHTMHGVKKSSERGCQTRKICENCGGNKTKYNHENPHPECWLNDPRNKG